jgi:hypothetical protein
VVTNLGVSANGAIYENRGTGGLWYAAPGATSFTEIDSATQNTEGLYALPDGSVYIDRYDSVAAHYRGWYWSPNLQGLGIVNVIADTTAVYPPSVGKDGDVFLTESSSGPDGGGTGYWSPRSAYHTLGNTIPGFLASQR